MNNQRVSLGNENLELAVKMWPGELGHIAVKVLNSFSEKYGISIALGDLLLLDGKWYVTHAGLLRIAQRRRCHGIKTSLQYVASDPMAHRWVFKAIVFKTGSFEGLCRLRRRRSVQHVFPSSRRRNARCRDASR